MSSSYLREVLVRSAALGCACAAFVLTSGPVAAASTVTLGPALPTPSGVASTTWCTADCSFFNQAFPSPIIAQAPVSGTITTWRAQGLTESAELIVVQSSGSGAYSIVAESAPGSAQCVVGVSTGLCESSGRNVATFSTDLPISAGQYIGISLINPSNCDTSNGSYCAQVGLWPYGDISGPPPYPYQYLAFASTPPENTPTMPSSNGNGDSVTVNADEVTGSSGGSGGSGGSGSGGSGTGSGGSGSGSGGSGSGSGGSGSTGTPPASSSAAQQAQVTQGCAQTKASIQTALRRLTRSIPSAFTTSFDALTSGTLTETLSLEAAGSASNDLPGASTASTSSTLGCAVAFDGSGGAGSSIAADPAPIDRLWSFARPARVRTYVVASLVRSFSKPGIYRLTLKLNRTGRNLLKAAATAERRYYRRHPKGRRAPPVRLAISLHYTPVS